MEFSKLTTCKISDIGKLATTNPQTSFQNKPQGVA